MRADARARRERVRVGAALQCCRAVAEQALQEIGVVVAEVGAVLRVARARGQKRFGAPDCRVARLRFVPGARGQRGVMFCGHGERGAAIVVFVYDQ